MALQQTDIEKDKSNVRLRMKAAARVLLNAQDMMQSILELNTALGLNFNAQTEPEAVNSIFAFTEILAAFTEHKTNIAKAADIGDNIN
jgi:hypothetical protein